MVRRLFPLLPLVALAACVQVSERPDGVPLPSADEVFPEITHDVPFREGTVRVSAPGRHGLRTFALVPCRGGDAICGESLQGPAGSLTRTDGIWQVVGAYPQQSFYLSPGGDGYMVDRGARLPIAWD